MLTMLLILQVQKTVALYMRLHYVDHALQSLSSTASNLFNKGKVTLALKILDKAINIAEVNLSKYFYK